MEENKKLDPVKKLFKEAFWFYINRFWKLTGIILMPIVAVILLSAPFIILHFLGINVFTAVGVLAIIFFVIFFLVFQGWSILALIYAIKEESGILQAFQQSRHIFFSFLWIGFLSSLIILGGFFMGIIPGIIFSIWFIFSAYLLVDKNLKGFNALLKSKEYVKGYWWGIVGRSLASSLFIILINVFVYLVISLIINKEVGELARNIANVILMPFSVVFMFFLYRNLVALKPELAAAPVSGKRGFFIFSAVLGVLVMLIIPVAIALFTIWLNPVTLLQESRDSIRIRQLLTLK